MNSFVDKLPIEDAGHECQILDNDGNLCPNKSAYRVSANIDPEFYKYDVQWVSFYVCEKHYKEETLFHS